MIYKILPKIKFELSSRVIRLKTKRQSKGNVLISYITLPFLIKDEHMNGHTNRWECKEMAKIFIDHGYNVDIIDWDNKKFTPERKYAFFIDINQNMERLSPLLNKDCVKIFHITTSHWKFQNEAEKKRLDDLEKRKGVRLVPRRQLEKSNGIELADIVTMLGNDTTESTYAYANKKIFRIPLSTTHVYKYSYKKEFEKVKKNFIWLGGAGMIHKGLNLVLEAFKELPDYKLSVFGNVSGESDFNKAYYHELYETPNVKTFGKVDVGGELFIQTAKESVGLVYPTCSEGQSGAVITALHAGLIPITNRSSGIDCDDFGIVLNDNSVEEIKKAVLKLGNMGSSELSELSLAAYTYANTNHTREVFSKTYNLFVSELEKQYNHSI